MSISETIIASNRLPVSVRRTESGFTYEQSAGGLATAMSSLTVDQTVWVGWPGIASDGLTTDEMKEIRRELRKRHCIPIFLSSEEIKHFYEGYSNDTIWPMFHYFPSLADHDDKNWAAYVEVNRKYSRTIARLAKQDTKIWIHDYHLMITPRLLRHALPNASIGFFLHIPFPSFEIFRLLPERQQLLEGLLGADVIGFHVYDYGRHFISSCRRLLGITNEQSRLYYSGRKITIDAYPIGIDYERYQNALSDPAVKHILARLKKQYSGQKILLSIDRLDYTKGILKRLSAYKLLLEHNEALRGRIQLVMVAVPSRTEVETYQKLRDKIEQTIARINGAYGTTTWAPISYQFKNLPFEEIVALYMRADIALITPLRDGMNLVAKEYVASKAEGRGVLILSEMTGAIDELPEALSVNPNDAGSIWLAIEIGLKMPKAEQTRRLELMRHRIREYSVHEWCKHFLTDLNKAAKTRVHAHEKYLIDDSKVALIRRFRSAKSRLVILDYDGTLQTFKNPGRPSAAKPSARVLRYLTELSSLPETKVCIVSGRSKSNLDEWFGEMPVTLVAEHGAWIKTDKGWAAQAKEFQPTKKKVLPVLHKYATKTAGAQVEEKDFSLVWHYRNTPPELAYIRTQDLKRELHALLEGTDIGVHGGNKIVEIKSKSIHKGASVRALRKAFPSELILCVGDDYTDEHMFEALDGDAVTIKIGPGETKANFQLDSVQAMLRLLESLTKD